jgi:hypothetical protein
MTLWLIGKVCWKCRLKSSEQRRKWKERIISMVIPHRLKGFHCPAVNMQQIELLPVKVSKTHQCSRHKQRATSQTFAQTVRSAAVGVDGAFSSTTTNRTPEPKPSPANAAAEPKPAHPFMPARRRIDASEKEYDSRCVVLIRVNMLVTLHTPHWWRWLCTPE